MGEDLSCHESLLWRTDRGPDDLASSVVQNDAKRVESFGQRGKRRYRGGYRGPQQPTDREPDVKKSKLAKIELSGEERKRHELRVKIKIQDFREGGRPPQFSNAELVVLTDEQQALVDAELERRLSQPARDTTSGAPKPKAAGQQPPKAPEGNEGEKDGDGETEDEEQQSQKDKEKEKNPDPMETGA